MRAIGPDTYEYVWRFEKKHTTRHVAAAAKVLGKLRRSVLERLTARLEERPEPITVPTPLEWRAWHHYQDCKGHERKRHWHVAARLCQELGGNAESRRVQSSDAVKRVEAFRLLVPSDFAMWAAIMNPVVKND